MATGQLRMPPIFPMLTPPYLVRVPGISSSRKIPEKYENKLRAISELNARGCHTGSV
jgi:hypothetical protein